MLNLSTDVESTGTDASIASVAYYVDSSGAGSFDPNGGEYQLLWTFDSAGDDGAWALPNIDASKYTGDEMFYAVATNSDGWSSAPESVDATFDQPVIASIGVSTDVSGDVPMLTLSANGIQDGVGNVTSVAFYRDTSGTGVYDSSKVTPVGTTDGTDGAGIEIDPRTLSGPETFFAIATDDGSYTSVPVAAAVNPVVIGAAAASNANLYANGEPITLTAADLVDWNVGQSVTGVTFYPADGEGGFDDSLPLATAASADSDGNWSVTITPSDWSGEQTIYAVATDGTSSSMPVAIVVDPHQAPAIDGVSAATDTTTGSHYITLTANGVADGSAVTSVDFYQVGAGSGGSDLLLGTESDADFAANPGAGWSLSGIDTSGFTGAEQFYAVVTNDAAQTTTSATLTVSEVTIGSIASDPGQFVAGNSLTLSANDVLDWNSGSPAQTVTFYQDTTGSGDFADATQLSTGASYTFSGERHGGLDRPADVLRASDRRRRRNERRRSKSPSIPISPRQSIAFRPFPTPPAARPRSI